MLGATAATVLAQRRWIGGPVKELWVVVGLGEEAVDGELEVDDGALLGVDRRAALIVQQTVHRPGIASQDRQPVFDEAVRRPAGERGLGRRRSGARLSVRLGDVLGCQARLDPHEQAHRPVVAVRLRHQKPPSRRGLADRDTQPRRERDAQRVLRFRMPLPGRRFEPASCPFGLGHDAAAIQIKRRRADIGPTCIPCSAARSNNATGRA